MQSQVQLDVWYNDDEEDGRSVYAIEYASSEAGDLEPSKSLSSLAGSDTSSDDEEDEDDFDSGKGRGKGDEKTYKPRVYKWRAERKR